MADSDSSMALKKLNYKDVRRRKRRKPRHVTSSTMTPTSIIPPKITRLISSRMMDPQIRRQMIKVS